jgi:hypothetical protein
VSIWIVVWIILSVIMIGFLGWTIGVLLKQKASWKAFAKNHKLRYVANKFMYSPTMDGVIDGHKFSFFQSEHTSADIKGTRNLTAIEVNLNSVLPADATIASAGLVSVAKELNFKAEVTPEFKGWDENYIALTDNKPLIEAYLTDERLDVLTRLMKIKGVWVMLISLQDTLLLRVDMPDPLMSADTLEKTKKRLLMAAKILELKDGESKRLKTAEAQANKRDVSLKVDDDTIADLSGLQLEDDHENDGADAEEPKDETKA